MPTARKYTEVRLPWFEYYDGDRTALEGAKQLAGLDDCAFVCRCPDVPPERREFASVAPRTYETAHHTSELCIWVRRCRVSWSFWWVSAALRAAQ